MHTLLMILHRIHDQVLGSDHCPVELELEFDGSQVPVEEVVQRVMAVRRCNDINIAAIAFTEK